MKEFAVLKDYIDKIDTLTAKVTNNQIPIFFDKISLSVSFGSSEAGFLRLVSFLYVLIYEGNGKVNFDFVAEKFEHYGYQAATPQEFKIVCHCLRTVLQHNLNPDGDKDSKKMNLYNEWMMSTTGKEDGLTESDWILCVARLLDDANKILKSIHHIISCINSESEFRDLILRDWVSKFSAYYPIFRYHEIAADVLKNFGLATLDHQKICNKYYKSWISELQSHSNFDFSSIAKRQVERDILVEFERNFLCPLDGDDIIKVFQVAPGLRVKGLLIEAHKSYKSNPCDREELISRMRAHLQK
jgi:hypothetical protein